MGNFSLYGNRCRVMMYDDGQRFQYHSTNHIHVYFAAHQLYNCCCQEYKTNAFKSIRFYALIHLLYIDIVDSNAIRVRMAAIICLFFFLI